MTAEALRIELPVFEGPFDLLLHLIRENQIDILDIPIAKITDQYLDYLQRMQEMDLEVASSFLVMAATLLSIKAKLLLPHPTEEEVAEGEDAREELVRDLLEYMRFKEVAQTMNEMHEEQKRLFIRHNEPEEFANLFSHENPLDGKTLRDLETAFQHVLAKAKDRGVLVMQIHREQVTLEDRMEYLFHQLLDHPDGISFADVFETCNSRLSFIVTFLALLELVRQGVVVVVQSQEFGEIYLHSGDLSKYEREWTEQLSS